MEIYDGFDERLARINNNTTLSIALAVLFFMLERKEFCNMTTERINYYGKMYTDLMKKLYPERYPVSKPAAATTTGGSNGLRSNVSSR